MTTPYPLGWEDLARATRMGWSTSLDLLSEELVAELPLNVGSCLELGAGQGAFTRFLRGHSPEAELVCLDLGKVANVYASQVVCGSAENLPFQSRTFAAVACRLTLVYVTDLPATVKEIARVLQPGGLFVAQELLIDRARPSSNVHPQLPSFITLTSWMAELWSRTTTERVPLRLPGILQRAGFSDARFASRPAMMLETGDAWVRSRLSQLDETRPALVTHGIASEDEVAALRAQLVLEYGEAKDIAGIGLTTVGIRAQRD